jgi:hypothetical protein
VPRKELNSLNFCEPLPWAIVLLLFAISSAFFNMALMLAPYNSAMRLGMGFNSYTQALCVNDVVRKPGNVTATEGDLRAAQLTARADAANEQTKKLTAGVSPQHVLEGAQGRVTRTIVDGQKEVSQVVSWEATFVENSSDILSKLDVSGMMVILSKEKEDKSSFNTEFRRTFHQNGRLGFTVWKSRLRGFE